MLYVRTLGSILILFSVGCNQLIEGVHEELSQGRPGANQFQAAKVILARACVDCHGPGSGMDLSMSTEAAFVSHGMIVPGEPENSKIIKRSRYYGAPDSNMPLSPKPFTEADYQVLYSWIQNIGEETPKVPRSTVGKFLCLPEEAKKEPENLVRLKKIEYINSLNSVGKHIPWWQQRELTDLQNFKDIFLLIPEDNSVDHRYSGFDLTISETHLYAYYKTSIEYADYILGAPGGKYTRIQGIMNDQGYQGRCMEIGRGTTATDECYEDLIKAIGGLLYRRPLSDIEVQHYLNRSEGITDKLERGRKIVVLLANSPHFLFRINDEFTLDPKRAGFGRLSEYEIASKLSFTFWQDSPDQVLYNLAKEEKLSTAEGMNQAMEHIFVTKADKVKSTLKSFYDEYLKVASIPEVDTQKTAVFAAFAGDSSISQYSAVTKVAMEEEIYDLMNYYTWDEPSDFAKTLTTDKYVVKEARLAKLYGDESKVWDGSSDMSFDPSQRAGILTRAGMLVTGGHQTSPIHTGVHVYRDIMCETIPSPPVLDPDDLIADIDPISSTREQVHALTVENKTNCAGCHQKFNGFGYTFEMYDALGRLRSDYKESIFEEDGRFVADVPIRTDAQIKLGDDFHNITNAVDLSQSIAKTPYPNNCYSKNLFEFVKGRPADLTKDGCELKIMSEKMNQSDGGGMLETLKSFTEFRDFTYRKLPEDLQ